jgi:hypothetical protein
LLFLARNMWGWLTLKTNCLVKNSLSSKLRHSFLLLLFKLVPPHTFSHILEHLVPNKLLQTFYLIIW